MTEIIVQYAAAIDFDYSNGKYPTGDEPQWIWEENYIPVEHYNNETLVQPHSFMRLKVGKTGRFTNPIRIVGIPSVEDVETLVNDLIENLSHLNLKDIGAYNHSQIDSHIDNTTIHFTQQQINHNNLINKGTNTHAQIDTHIADGSIHTVYTASNGLNRDIDDIKLGGTIDEPTTIDITSNINVLTVVFDNGTYSFTTNFNGNFDYTNIATNQTSGISVNDNIVIEVNDNVNSSNITLNSTDNSITITSDDADFEGVKYGGDYSSKYVDRSLVDKEYVITITGNYIPTTEKGSANGVATLDVGGKVPASQLPASIMQFQGNWNATTNTPTLVDGVGDTGDIYYVSVAGTQDLGSGSQVFKVGDWVLYDSSNQWKQSDNSDEVVSVNGLLGAVVLDLDDINDVNITTPLDGQVLKYNSGQWINGTDSSNTASNGLNVDGIDIQLGGTLTENTTINTDTFFLDINNGKQNIYIDSTSISLDSINSVGVTPVSKVELENGTLVLQSRKNDLTKDININLNENIGIITLTGTGADFKYAADYSVTPGFSLRSLVDKDYVDSAISAIPTITASNGLTKSVNDIQLGGTLTGSVNIDTNGNQFSLNDVGGTYLNFTPSQIILNSANTMFLGVNGEGTGLQVVTTPIAVTNNGSNNNLIIHDDISSKGLVYNSDYSANFTPESLVSKRYVVYKPITTKTGNYTATIDDHTILCNATGASFSIALPTAASSSGQVLVIKKIDSSSNTITIDPNGVETLDGVTTRVLSTQYASVILQSNGTSWSELGNNYSNLIWQDNGTTISNVNGRQFTITGATNAAGTNIFTVEQLNGTDVFRVNDKGEIYNSFTGGAGSSFWLSSQTAPNLNNLFGITTSTNVGNATFVMGLGANSGGSDSGFAVGNSAAGGLYATAVGNNSTASTHGTAVGNQAKSGGYNIGTGGTSVGREAGLSLSFASGAELNALFGTYTGRNVTTGSYNTLVGSNSGAYSISTGSYNTALGYGTGGFYGNVYNGSRSIFIGFSAGAYQTASDLLILTNQQKTTQATHQAAAIIYGVMSSTTANQTLQFNSSIYVGGSTSAEKRIGFTGEIYPVLLSDATASISNSLFKSSEKSKVVYKDSSDRIITAVNAVHTTVNASTYTILVSDSYVFVDYTVTGACTLTLPSCASFGYGELIIKDSGCNSATNNITINRAGSDTMITTTTGGTSATINSNGNALKFYCDGVSKWLLI